MPHNKYWHKVMEDCPDCEDNLSLVQVWVSADGQFKLCWFCLKCQKKHETTHVMTECICTAFEADLTQEFFEDPKDERQDAA